MKKNPTENLEYIAIAASVIGTIISALSSQAVYAAMPITLSLFLNLVNRNDVKKQTQSNVNISLTSTKNDILSKVGRKIEEIPDLTERVESLTDKLNNVSINLGNSQQQTQNNFASLNSKIEEIPDLSERVESLNNRLNDVSVNLGNSQKQTQNNFDSLSSSIEEVSCLTERVKSLTDELNNVSINLGNSQQQTQNNFASLNSRIEKIPDLNEQVKSLTDELNDVSINLGNSQQQKQNNFDALNSRTEKIPDLTEQVESQTNKLNNVSINLGNSQQQTQNNFDSLNSKIEGIPDLIERVTGLADKLNNVSINLDNSQQQIQNNFNSLNSKIEEIPDLIENNVGTKFMRVNLILNKIKPCNYELIYDRSQIRQKLFESLKQVQNRLVMVCPWVSDSAIDTNLQNQIKQTLHNNGKVKIYIGCGNRRDIDDLASDLQSNPRNITLDMLVNKFTTWKYSAVPTLKMIETQYPNQMHLKVLGTHEKFLVCDNSWAVITSHNFLTSGTTKKEREVGLLTNDKNIINSLINRYNEDML